MDYKKIIKSRKVREQILRLLRFVPDKTMVKIQYRIKTGRKLNLKNPQRYTEKLQWYKLYYKNPLMIKCVDKYDVREYVKSLGLEEILNECYGVFDKVEDIDFDKLPNQFVMKDTLGGGGDRVIICKDKTNFDIEGAKKKMQEWVSEPIVKFGGREWPYYSGKGHRIIIEKFLECDDGDLPDYKFFCFNGKSEFFYIKVDYAKAHDEGKLTFFDKDFKQLCVKMDYCNLLAEKIEPPEEINRMIELSNKISKDFPHVRVDFYLINGKIYFGEMTFYNASGYMTFEPDEFDFEMGSKFSIERVG